VSALSGFTLRLQNTELTTEQKQYVKNIATSSNHLLNIINDVLDISRIETGNLKLDKTAFSVYEVAKEVVDLLSIKALEKNLELNFEGEKVKDFSVIGDSMRLRQVLFNVIGNAIKFTESGSVKLQIENLKHENQISNFRFQISDTGIGIPSEKIKTIFKPFEQADMGIARKFGGTGLGLSITKKIVELHGGTIDVKSETEKGTTFSIDIPYEINEGLAQDKFENGNLKFEIANKAYPKNEKFLSGINVLLAEDDDLNRILQQSMLNDLGASVDAVSNGEEVLFKLQSKKYDVLLMDLQMPEIGGIEAATRIRNDLKSAIPIVAITANVHATDKEKCFAAGINDVLIKPFSEQQLIEKISALIKIENKYAVEFVEEIKQVEISKPYSLDALRKASNGNPDFVARMLKVFCMSGESLMQKAEEGMMTLDKEKIASSVHRLIPSCRQLALNDLSASLKQVENLCAGENDFSRVKDLLMQSKNNFTNIVAMLQHEIQLLEKAKTES
jgi:CheY-like chemotaxis protein/HPt (histidine-containing phosphotransfer) domain-containing protein